jgi:hypothetical protein
MLMFVVRVVLPLTAEGPHSSGVAQVDAHEQAHNISNQVFDETSATWFDNSLQGLDDETAWADEGNFDITGNGLYWFWDSTWGESRS